MNKKKPQNTVTAQHSYAGLTASEVAAETKLLATIRPAASCRPTEESNLCNILVSVPIHLNGPEAGRLQDQVSAMHPGKRTGTLNPNLERHVLDRYCIYIDFFSSPHLSNKKNRTSLGTRRSRSVGVPFERQQIIQTAWSTSRKQQKHASCNLPSKQKIHTAIILTTRWDPCGVRYAVCSV